MRKILVAVALAMLGALMLAPAVGAQSRGPSGADGSYNCSDFDTQEQAQAYYESQGGLNGPDPVDLDDDLDGIACETLPSGGTATPPATSEQPAVIQQYSGEQNLMEAGGTVLPDTGGPAILPLAGAMLLAGGLFGARLIRKR